MIYNVHKTERDFWVENPENRVKKLFNMISRGKGKLLNNQIAKLQQDVDAALERTTNNI